MMEVVVTTELLELYVVQSSSQIITTNKPTSRFFTGRMPFLSRNKVSKHWREKYHISWTCLPQAHLGVFQLSLWPLIVPGYLGGGLPCLSSALWCQYPQKSTFHIYIPLSDVNAHDKLDGNNW